MNARVRVALAMPELLRGLVTLTLQHVECDVALDDQPAQAALLDLDHPNGHGRPGTASVLGLTRHWDPAARFAALEAGADDLIQVPFAPAEIVLRTLAALRRVSGGPVPLRPRTTVGRFEVDLLEGGVRLDGQLVRLTVLEQTLLYMLMAHPERILDRDDILSNIWGERGAVTSNVIDRHIRDLRVKLQESWRSPRFIETIPGKGYRFIGNAGGTRAN